MEKIDPQLIEKARAHLPIRIVRRDLTPEKVEAVLFSLEAKINQQDDLCKLAQSVLKEPNTFDRGVLSGYLTAREVINALAEYVDPRIFDPRTMVAIRRQPVPQSEQPEIQEKKDVK